MQFKHPEILYFLFLLVIPILVHLFQLRRFKKEYFTNVKLLKELQIQTRKSSKIKKWLLLATRLLLLACLIIAFAQPFFDAKDTTNKGNELIILLDNSFSMQAKGVKGELLKRSIQDLLEELPENQQFSLLTNSEVFWDTDIKTIQKELQNLKYSAMPFQLDYLINQVETKKKNTKKDYVIISDAIQSESKKALDLAENNVVYFIQPEAQNKTNISIDKVAISQVLDQFYELKITLQAFGETENEVPLSVFSNNKAIAKTIAKFENQKTEIAITIPKNDFHGNISIEDNSLSYDNDYYLSISKPEKANVIAIGNSDKNNFLSRIFTADEFNFQSTELATLDYNQIENQDAIVLNELEDLPVALGTTLKSFYEKGGNIVLIPNAKNTPSLLNAFAKNFGGFNYSQLTTSGKQITKINFNHPLYQTVFEKKISNFQYPNVKESFILSGITNILQYEDNSVFVGSTTNRLGTFYAFSAPINKQNSNFQNAPLIVPTFYNMGQNQGKTGINAYTIGENENLILETILAKDEVVSVQKDGYSFIPMQQILNTKCKLSFGDYPEEAGNFDVIKANNSLKKISFNYARTESDLTQVSTANFENFNKVNNISTVLNDIASERTSNEIWKWFIIATLLFLITELLIQKFVKMTQVILKQAKIIDASSPFHNQVMDIKIENGTITQIEKEISATSGFEVVNIPNLHVSKGWMDSSVSFGEPGYEDRETIENGLKVAAKSGFTAVALQPNSNPTIDNQAQVRFVLDRAKNQATTLYPIGALTKGSEGTDLAELFDMKNAGAIAFGDYKKALQNANLQKIALQYVQDFDGMLIAFCQDSTLKGIGIANEGVISTKLGMKGIPALAEELQVARNLFLLEYTGGKLHIPTISTQGSIKLIKEAKVKGLQVTCSVAVHNLVLNDEMLMGFDTRHKVLPPLREEATRKALLEAVLDGTIDCITSDHNPLDIEHKKLEFDLAKDGTIGLESALGALLTVLPLEVVVEKLNANKMVFNVENPSIISNIKADISLFTTEENWTFGKENILSKSKNSAFLGQKMKGKAIGIYNNGQLIINN